MYGVINMSENEPVEIISIQQFADDIKDQRMKCKNRDYTSMVCIIAKEKLRVLVLFGWNKHRYKDRKVSSSDILGDPEKLFVRDNFGYVNLKRCECITITVAEYDLNSSLFPEFKNLLSRPLL
jgi:hypothetical protein